VSADIPGGWVALALGIIGSGGLSGLYVSRGTKEGALIDQYQERYSEQVAEIRDLKETSLIQAKEITTLQRQNITLRQYVVQLYEHISSGKPPPPPAPPGDMFT
jgi:hypothetical protein